ncbi:MAG: thioredoxin family protein [Anaerolineales bacterium]|nr:thioredoxin family protein [Anaerolineales bacterium]
MITVKILALRHPERYAVRRMVLSTLNELHTQYPDLAVEIAEISDPSEIGKYALVLVLPSLVINEKLVCSGRFPSKDEVVAWLREALW